MYIISMLRTVANEIRQRATGSNWRNGDGPALPFFVANFSGNVAVVGGESTETLCVMGFFISDKAILLILPVVLIKNLNVYN